MINYIPSKSISISKHQYCPIQKRKNFGRKRRNKTFSGLKNYFLINERAKELQTAMEDSFNDSDSSSCHSESFLPVPDAQSNINMIEEEQYDLSNQEQIAQDDIGNPKQKEISDMVSIEPLFESPKVPFQFPLKLVEHQEYKQNLKKVPPSEFIQPPQLNIVVAHKTSEVQNHRGSLANTNSLTQAFSIKTTEQFSTNNPPFINMTLIDQHIDNGNFPAEADRLANNGSMNNIGSSQGILKPLGQLRDVRSNYNEVKIPNTGINEQMVPSLFEIRINNCGQSPKNKKRGALKGVGFESSPINRSESKNLTKIESLRRDEDKGRPMDGSRSPRKKSRVMDNSNDFTKSRKNDRKSLVTPGIILNKEFEALSPGDRVSYFYNLEFLGNFALLGEEIFHRDFDSGKNFSTYFPDNNLEKILKVPSRKKHLTQMFRTRDRSKSYKKSMIRGKK
jgi:hypothetical protein